MNIKRIMQLVKILETSIVNEIEVTDFFGRKIRLNKSSNNAKLQEAVEVPIAGGKSTSVPSQEKITSNTVSIKSPIVGTFYRSPSPDATPYVDIGDVVKPGQVVCIIEAMKLMNEIESDVAGKIVKILVKNEDPIEYNQDIFVVEPV